MKALLATGLSEEQAEVIAKGLQQVHIGNVATKDDLANVRDELKADIGEVRQELARINTRLDACATQADLKDLKADFLAQKPALIQWMIGVQFGFAALIIGVLKLL